MKKFTLSFVLLLIAAFAFAQNVITPQEVSSVRELKGIELTKAPVDTLMLDEFFVDVPQIFGMVGGGYVFGVNANSNKKCAQGFLNLNPTLTIEEVLIWVGGLYAIGGNSSLTVTVTAIDGTSSYTGGGVTYDISCPGTVKSTSVVDWASIDSGSSFDAGCTHALLTAPLLLSSDYAIVVDYSDCYLNSDTVGFVCSYEGGASANAGIEYTWWQYPAATPFWAQSSHIFTSVADNMIAFFPVVSDQVGIMENDFVNGVKLSQNFPNPALDGSTTIQYALESSSNVVLDVFDYNGRLVQSFNQGSQSAGSYAVVLSKPLSAGTYYYSLVACGTRLTKKMVIK
jgi:hypothetical protein